MKSFAAWAKAPKCKGPTSFLLLGVFGSKSLAQSIASSEGVVTVASVAGLGSIREWAGLPESEAQEYYSALGCDQSGLVAFTPGLVIVY